MKIKSTFKRIVPLLMILLAARAAAPAQALDGKEIKAAVQTIALAFESGYVYPELGRKMAGYLRQKAAAGKYDALAGGRDLARQITEDLQSISADRHAVVFYKPEQIQRRKNTDLQQLADKELQSARRANFGFEEARVLDGNVGYLKLSSFDGSAEAFAAAAAALQFLSHCEALILDVRFNPGGDPAMAQFLASFFLEGEPVLLDELHYRRDGRVEQLWSLPYVPGSRLTRTVLDSYLLFVPVAFSKNPVTGTNFQGKGVQPDLKANGKTAVLDTQIHALEQLLKKNPDQSRKAELENILAQLRPGAAAVK